MSSPSGHQPAPPAVMDGMYGAIQRCVRALLVPSAALFYECNLTRLGLHANRLATFDLALDIQRKQAFAAATRLLSLDPPPKRESADMGFTAATDAGAAS